MKLTGYPLDDETCAVATKWFETWNPEEDAPVYAVRLDSDDGCNTYIAVLLERNAKTERGTMWVDWKLFESSGVVVGEEGIPLFGDAVGMSDLKTVVCGDDTDFPTASGFCKWDGCREFEVGRSHQCWDTGAANLLAAVMTVMTMASRKAGYEGDER